MKQLFTIIAIGFLLTTMADGQVDSTSVSSPALEKNRRLFILPVVSYSPETSLRLGAVGVYLFRGKNATEGTQLSSIKAPLTYTLNNQSKVRVSYDIFLSGNKHILDGAIQWQRFPLFFYGIGANTPQENEELFTSRTFAIDFSYLNNITGNFFLGGRLVMANSKITDKADEGQLVRDGLVPGNNGGTTIGAGLQLRFDQRDNNLNPSCGPFLETSLTSFQQFLGSEFIFTKLTLDLREYFQPFGKHVLALQLFSEYNWGDPPFEFLALLGGDQIMRGHYEGRFRDKGYWAAQLEYRLPLGRKKWFPDEQKLTFWQKWGIVGFAGLGTVGEDPSDLVENNLKYTLGIGLRYLIIPKERVNVRVDFGFGTQKPGFYLNVREVF